MSQKLLKAQPDGWWGDEEAEPILVKDQINVMQSLVLHKIGLMDWYSVLDKIFVTPPLVTHFKNSGKSYPGGKKIEENLVYEKGDE